MKEIYENYTSIVIFLHILAAVVWVGGMIAIRFAVHPALQSIDDVKIKLGKTLQIVGRLFNLVMPFIFVSLICALIIIIGGGYSGGIVHLKEAIWTIMTLNFFFMYAKRLKAQKLFNQGDFVKAKEAVAILPTMLLPINIVLGLVAIFAGVLLRGY
jgi:uncharacterized membrane protein